MIGPILSTSTVSLISFSANYVPKRSSEEKNKQREENHRENIPSISYFSVSLTAFNALALSAKWTNPKSRLPPAFAGGITTLITSPWR